MVLIPRKSTYLFLFLSLSFCLLSCAQKSQKQLQIKTGAERTELYLSKLSDKKVAIVANQTSVIKRRNIAKKRSKHTFTHVVDSLLSLGVDIQKVFAPEHGFRGKADAGELIKDGIDKKTNLPIVSLYGKNKKPSKEQLQNIDVVLFDIQDVGARFYTYISSLHYVMEACAELEIPVIILDRPNPNGHYIDGPILEKEYQSFVGMHPVPVVYGMTIGEYGQMINGELWLKDKIQCSLEVIPLQNYTHQSQYSLPIKPSPNLPNDTAINLYPSLCFFEGTYVSAGRGTDMQFQVAGATRYNHDEHQFVFVPEPNEGAKYPKNQGKRCYGFDLRNHERLSEIDLQWLISFYKANQRYASYNQYFNSFFVKLAGTSKLSKQIEEGLSQEAIKASWEQGLNAFKKTRSKYLIYK